jgi:hypothetical protein
MIAVEGGHVEVVKLFLKLDYQCDTNIQDKVFHAHDYQIEYAYIYKMLTDPRVDRPPFRFSERPRGHC